MAKITQYSRISHHTISGSASGLTFSIPPSEDFTDGSWTMYDLSYSEIGVNEADKKAYIRIDDEVKEFQFVGGTAGAQDLSTTLGVGNTTGANDIIVEQNITDTTGNTYLSLIDGYSEFSSTATSSITGNSTQDLIYLDPGVSNVSTGIQSADLVTGDDTLMSIHSTYFNTYTQNSLSQTTLDVTASLGRIYNNDLVTSAIHRVYVDNTQVQLLANDGSEISSILLDSSGKRIQIQTPDFNTSGYNGHIITGGYTEAMNVISFETVNTTNNTTTTLHSFSVSGNGPKSYRVRVVGYKDDYTKAYLAELFGLYLYDGSTVSLIGTLDKVEKTNFTTATSTIDISGTNIRVRVTGETSNNITWTAYVQTNNYQ